VTILNKSSAKALRPYADHIVRENLKLALKCEEGVCDGQEPEFIHRMRVAIRRALTAFRVFGKAISPDARAYQPFLKHLIKALGQVRDLDIQIGLAKEAGCADKFHLLKRQRHHAQMNLVHHFESIEYKNSIADLTNLLARHYAPIEDFIAIKDACKNIIKKHVVKFRKFGHTLDETSDPQDFHRLRILGKRLRYTLEFLRPVFGNKTKDLIKKMSHLQKDLGQIHDLYIARKQLLKINEYNSNASTIGKSELKRRRHFIEAFKQIDWRELMKSLEI